MHVLTILGYIMLETDRPWLLSYGRVLICTTTLRLIKIARNSKMIIILIDTFMLSMPSILAVGALLLLIIYIYTILGMQMFGQVKLQSNLNS